MTAAVFRVAFAGPHVTVQDGGRVGMMRFGVTGSGPMDRKAFAIANAALGNAPGTAGIEVSLGGLALECVAGAVSVAVVGGGFIVEAGGRKTGSWSVVEIRAGQRLVVRRGPWGSWCYLAFAGQLRAAEWLGSFATHGPSGLGGGRVVTGQEVVIEAASPRGEGAVPCPVWARPRHGVVCVLGPQERFFDAETLRDFTHAPFELTDAYDRMGLRLRGPSLVPVGALSIPSEAILRGSVQVAGDGVATVLLADHQTTGGYPKIATLLADDVDGLVQCRPKDKIRFRAISAEQAVQVARSRGAWFRSYLAGLGVAARKNPQASDM